MSRRRAMATVSPLNARFGEQRQLDFLADELEAKPPVEATKRRAPRPATTSADPLAIFTWVCPTDAELQQIKMMGLVPGRVA